jgi:hypothetical protein
LHTTTPAPPAKTAEEQQKEADEQQKEAEQKHWAKNPYAPIPEGERDDPHIAAKKAARVQQFAVDKTAILKRANELGLLVKGKVPAGVNQLITTKLKQAQADMKELDHQQQQLDVERRQQTSPRDVGLDAETKLTANAGAYDMQRQKLEKTAKDQPDSETARVVANSPLRYSADHSTIKEIATEIWRNNKGITSTQAYNLALNATSILPPTKDDPDPVGQNRQKAGNATRFVPVKHGRDVLLRFSDGTEARVDHNTYTEIQNQHRQNWAQYQYSKTEKGKQEAADKKNAVSWKTAGGALRTVAPLVQLGTGNVLGAFPGARNLADKLRE